jgi:uncharacterized OsmC-like protein
MNIEIIFDNNGKVAAMYGGREITMNESPYMVFLATAGLCSAVYVKAFMSQRGMSLEGVSLTQKMNYNRMTNMVEEIEILVNLPKTFPTKYSKAIIAVVNQCPVKQHFITPPKMEVVTNIDVEIEV